MHLENAFQVNLIYAKVNKRPAGKLQTTISRYWLEPYGTSSMHNAVDVGEQRRGGLIWSCCYRNPLSEKKRLFAVSRQELHLRITD